MHVLRLRDANGRAPRLSRILARWPAPSDGRLHIGALGRDRAHLTARLREADAISIFGARELAILTGGTLYKITTRLRRGQKTRARDAELTLGAALIASASIAAARALASAIEPAERAFAGLARDAAASAAELAHRAAKPIIPADLSAFAGSIRITRDAIVAIAAIRLDARIIKDA